MSSGNDDLDDSGDDGRVVLLAAEGSSPEIVNSRLGELQRTREKDIEKVNRAYAQAEATYRKTLQKE